MPSIKITRTPQGEGYSARRTVYVNCQFQLSGSESKPVPLPVAPYQDPLRDTGDAAAPLYYQVSFEAVLTGLQQAGFTDEIEYWQRLDCKPRYFYFPVECAKLCR